MKDFDTKGQVLYCGSFSKTLAPGLRVGWAVPGRYKEVVKRIKINTNIASPTLNQAMVAQFLKNGAYERHLRVLRGRLQNQMSNTARAIARYFPADTKITAPKGGLLLWTQLNPAVDTLKLYYRAREANIAVLPGALCATTDKYLNCLRISCGSLWGERLEKGIAQLGAMIGAMI
jgi:DNA-binding transcriptional MocR family regulator